MRMEICCTILMPVCLACQDFLLWHTALRKGNKAGMPRALATTENARAVVLRTYSSMLSISGLIAAIMVANPAACMSTIHDQILGGQYVVIGILLCISLVNNA